jgi:hypothetical protein
VSENVLKGPSCVVRRETESSFSISDKQRAKGTEFYIRGVPVSSFNITD